MPITPTTPPAAYIAWTGTDSSNTLNVQQVGASSQLPSTGNYSGNGPALAFFKGSLYLAWAGTDTQLSVMSLSSLNGTWPAKNPTKLGQYSNVGPALVAYADVLCIVWIGTDDKHKLNLLFSKDGIKWENHIKSEGTEVTSNLAPASAVGHFGLQAIAWVAAGTANKVTVLHGIECSAGIDRAKQLDAITIFEPALTFFQSNLYLVWTAANNNLVQMSYDGAEGVDGEKKWSSAAVINQPGSSPAKPVNAYNGPALAASTTTMYLAWADKTSQQLYVMTQAATGGWGNPTPVGSHTSKLAPALAFGSFGTSSKPGSSSKRSR